MARTAKKKEEKSVYDAVVYESFAYPQTHHNHLYTVATLFGMKPVDFKNANVLEIGCAGGGNLAPLAYAYPEANFFGIDISEEQIKHAEQMKNFLGVSNLEFQQQDIMKFKPQNKRDKYDYIICHGVFSWVSEVVRNKIFETCEEYLSDNGLAIISYNALPGWNAVRSLRDMMMFHVKRFDNPADKIVQARLLMQFLADNVSKSNSAYLSIIENEISLLNATNNYSYFFHDHLENENEQFYLSDFVRMAREYNLDYVGDTSVASMYIGNMPHDAMEKLKVINDVVEQEQYMDFIKNRRFRSSIICKAGQKVNRSLDKRKILDYNLKFAFPVTVNEDTAAKKTSFILGNASFETNDEISTAIFKELASYGMKPVSARELIANVQEKLKPLGTDAIETVLVDSGITLMLKGFVNVYSDIPHCVSEISQKPEAYKIARYEASMNNYSRNRISNVLSFVMNTDVFTNIVVTSLDGTKTFEEVVEILLEKTKDNIISVKSNEINVTDEVKLRELLARALDEVLSKLVQNNFLTA